MNGLGGRAAARIVALAALLLRTRYDENFSKALSLPVEQMRQAVCRAVAWLMEHVDSSQGIPSAPIGLYFARLWYFEELYPLIFTVSALQRVGNLLALG